MAAVPNPFDGTGVVHWVAKTPPTNPIYLQIWDAYAGIHDDIEEDIVGYQTADISAYDVPMTELGTASNHFVADFPTYLPKGQYFLNFNEQASGTPGTVSESDTIQDGMVPWYWNGTDYAVPAESTAVGLPVEGGKTNDQLSHLVACRELAKSVNDDSGNITYRNIADTADAIEAVVDAYGSRTSVTLTPP